MKEFFKKYKIHILSIISVMLIFAAIFANNILKYNNDNYNVYHEEMELQYEGAKCTLVNDVQAYIDSIAPDNNLSALVLVDKCLEYDIDICFVLAQGQKESHFGTRGLARKTNSVWNVFAYDGVKYECILSHGKYSHPNKSIEPYLKLLTDKYLVNNKTEYDLLNKYVDKNGHRYATDTTYEEQLRKIYSRIKTETTIDSDYQHFKKYKLLLGK